MNDEKFYGEIDAEIEEMEKRIVDGPFMGADGELYIYGWKFFNHHGTTKYRGDYYPYNLPGVDDGWSDWTVHPSPAEPDGRACGPGRLHMMRILSADYMKGPWWIWFAQGRGIVGLAQDKCAVHAIRVRRVSELMFCRLVQRGICEKANLQYLHLPAADFRAARLSSAYLLMASLPRANLVEAKLEMACLDNGNFADANFSGADMTAITASRASFLSAKFNNAKMPGAIIEESCFGGASFYRADLRLAHAMGIYAAEADFTEANLHGANFSGAMMPRSSLAKANLTNASFRGADLRYCSLRDAILQDTDFRGAVLIGTLLPSDWRENSITGVDTYVF